MTNSTETLGQVILKDLLKDDIANIDKLSKHMGTTSKYLKKIINGYARITPQFVGKFIKVAPKTDQKYWLTLQLNADLQKSQSSNTVKKYEKASCPPNLRDENGNRKSIFELIEEFILIPKGYTASQLARLLGYSNLSGLSNIKSGRNAITTTIAKKLSLICPEKSAKFWVDAQKLCNIENKRITQANKSAFKTEQPAETECVDTTDKSISTDNIAEKVSDDTTNITLDTMLPHAASKIPDALSNNSNELRIEDETRFEVIIQTNLYDHLCRYAKKHNHTISDMIEYIVRQQIHIGCYP